MRGITIVAVTAAGVVLALSGCGSPPQAAPEQRPPVAEVAALHVEGLPRQADSHAVAREVHQVSSIADMVALSDVVVVGTVLAVAPGRSAGTDEGGRLQWRDVAVEAEEVIHGGYSAETLTVEELGWKDGTPTTVNATSWAKVGDRLLLGLIRTANGEGIGGDRFILTSTATRFYLDDDGGVDDNYSDDRESGQFAREAAAKSVDQLLDETRAQR